MWTAFFSDKLEERSEGLDLVHSVNSMRILLSPDVTRDLPRRDLQTESSALRGG